MGFLPASRPSDTSTREASRQYAAQNRVVQWHEPEVYAPGEMGFTSAPGRDERWMQLPASVRERLWQYAGQEALLWWAFSSGEQRPKAVLFGNQALCFADPRVNTEHKPVYAVSVYHLDPASLRRAEVEHRPWPHSPPEQRRVDRSTRATAAGPPDVPPRNVSIRPQVREVLGHLPPRAQELLQSPFTSGQKILRQDHYYYGKAGGGLSVFSMVFAGPRDITAVEGTRTVPVGHTEANAHWSLRCYRATVVKRRGR